MRWLAICLLAACVEPVAPNPGATLAVGTPEARRYIVSLARGASPDAIAHAAGVSPRRVYRHALTGFSAALTGDGVERLRRHPHVRYVAPVGTVRVQSLPWGLDRIDQRALPLSGTYTAPNNGAGVTVYVLDTGVLAHEELANRVGSGFDFIDNDVDASDCRGHGTHVAGTVAGTTVGVANSATVISVRMLDCDGQGTTEEALAAIDWTIANHRKPAVINASWGSDVIEPPIDEAVQRAIEAGIVWVNAAGNGNRDACTHSPGRVPSALNMGASAIDDSRASFSDFGACVDLFAPGNQILSLRWLGGYRTLSGTSMASPHGAGVVAQYLAANPLASPAAVIAALRTNATVGVLANVGAGSPNLLLSTFAIGVGVLAPLPAPEFPPLPVPNFVAPVHVASMVGGSARPPDRGGRWVASVLVTARDGAGKPVYLYSVELERQPGGHTGICSLDFTGACTATWSVPNNVKQITATIRNVNPAELYDPAANVVSSVVIRRP